MKTLVKILTGMIAVIAITAGGHGKHHHSHGKMHKTNGSAQSTLPTPGTTSSSGQADMAGQVANSN